MKWLLLGYIMFNTVIYTGVIFVSEDEHFTLKLIGSILTGVGFALIVYLSPSILEKGEK